MIWYHGANSARILIDDLELVIWVMDIVCSLANSRFKNAANADRRAGDRKGFILVIWFWNK